VGETDSQLDRAYGTGVVHDGSPTAQIGWAIAADFAGGYDLHEHYARPVLDVCYGDVPNTASVRLAQVHDDGSEGRSWTFAVRVDAIDPAQLASGCVKLSGLADQHIDLRANRFKTELIWGDARVDSILPTTDFPIAGNSLMETEDVVVVLWSPGLLFHL